MATDIIVQRGCRTVWQITATEGGVAINLTGAAIYFEARQSPPGETVITTAGAVLVKSTADDITLVTPANGIFTILFDKADTNTLSPGAYYYGLEWLPSGETETRALGNGTLLITQDYVRGT